MRPSDICTVKVLGKQVQLFMEIQKPEPITDFCLSSTLKQVKFASFGRVSLSALVQLTLISWKAGIHRKKPSVCVCVCERASELLPYWISTAQLYLTCFLHGSSHMNGLRQETLRCKFAARRLLHNNCVSLQTTMDARQSSARSLTVKLLHI